VKYSKSMIPENMD